MAALCEPHGLGRVRSDAVLVPGDVPRDRDDQLAADAGEGHDARAGLSEALGASAACSPVVARFQDVGRLDHLLLRRRQTPQNRLGDDGIVRRLATRVEQRGEAAALAPALTRNGGSRRAALLDPAVLERDVGAKRADVHVLLAVGGEAQGTLPGEKGALADRADAPDLLPGELSGHTRTLAHVDRSALATVTLMCVLHVGRT